MCPIKTDAHHGLDDVKDCLNRTEAFLGKRGEDEIQIKLRH